MQVIHGGDMIRLAVVSGKGGTGKTVITGGIVHLSRCAKVMVDCDVDAANLELILNPRIIRREEFTGMEGAYINPAQCSGCGECSDACRFGAIEPIGDTCVVHPDQCEGCGVCRVVCPSEAISMRPRVCGEIYYSETPYGNLVHARLAPGAANSGLLVGRIKKIALERNGECDLMLVDGPPGIGCPLISTITGMDQVLAVTEPSVSGLHDLQRLIRVCRPLRVNMVVAINKYDLNPGISDSIREYCGQEGIPVLGMIPYDESVMDAVRNGRLVTEYDTPAAQAIHHLWHEIVSTLRVRADAGQ
ncbi:MAG TPA: ATP-binding protein [Methanoregulaceae archaeon]|nr:ATP-binding protein [Methanoregulaceae archaeon]